MFGTTVTTITAKLHGMVEKLEKHADAQEKAAAALLAHHEHAVAEHVRATSVAKKLKELLS